MTGGASQVAELRSGRTEDGQFFESLGGTLIHSRATYPDIVEQITPEDNTGLSVYRPTLLATASSSP